MGDEGAENHQVPGLDLEVNIVRLQTLGYCT